MKKILALILVFSGLGIGAGFATDKIGVGLYLAEAAPSSPEAKLAPERLHKHLHTIFGYDTYEMIKVQEIELNNDWSQWFVPRKDLFIRLTPIHPVPGEQKVVNYEIYQNGTIVAKGLYEPHHDTPLFIKGPDFKDGRFIFILEAKW